MKTVKLHIRLLAFLLCILLSGCGAGQAQLSQQEPVPQDAAIRLVNKTQVEPVERAGYGSENPSFADLVLREGGEDEPLQQASILFTDEVEDVQIDEIRAVWISYLEMNTLLTGKTASQFRSAVGEVFDNVRGFSLNTVIVHVRPFGDALYKSDYFPWSYLITGTEGKDPGFDPLAIMVEEARSRGLRIEAWVNPYRVRAAGNSNALSADNQAKIWLDDGDSAVIRYDGVTSFNPASEKARTLIIEGVREIVRNYDVDAVHIDDYFYPTTDTAFDAVSYNAYKSNGGTMSLADWRRDNVETLLQGIYAAVKDAKPHVKFGISPQGNVNINYNQQYLDVQKIASTAGYCDYICPQVYYGFNNENQPYSQVVRQWNDMVGGSKVELYIGLGAYKLGGPDNWAGAGKNEWLSTSTQLKDMVEDARGHSNYGGFVLYRYDSIFRPAASVKAQVDKEADKPQAHPLAARVQLEKQGAKL